MLLFREIQAITFDVGGTLIRPWPSVGHVYAEVAARHGHANLEPGDLNRQFAAAWRAKKDFDHSRQAWLGLVERTFAGSMDGRSVRKFFDDLYDHFAAPEAWRVFDEAHATLGALRPRFKLGIISNWDERLRPLLARLQLDSYFEVIVISVEAGFPKPSREIFERAASSLAVPAHSILHVGDSQAEDVTGAKSAGLQAVLLDRKASGGAMASVPTLASLRDVLLGG